MKMMTFHRKVPLHAIYDSISILGLILLIAFDSRTFFADYLPISVITSVVLFVLIMVLLIQYSAIFSQQGGIKIRIRSFDLFIGLLLILYGIRMFYNIFIEQILQNNFVNRYTFIVYYFFLMVLPVLLVRNIRFESLNLDRLFNILFTFLAISLVVIYLKVKFLVEIHNVDSTGRFRANELLDSIGYGHMGLTFLLLSIVKFRRSCSKWHKLIFLIMCLFGVFSMAIANSRSPFVALFFIIAVYLLTRMNIKWAILTVIVVILFLLNLNGINEFFKGHFQSTFIERFLSIFKGGHTTITISGREEYFRQGWKVFITHPIFGDSILLKEGLYRGDYVHNFFLEVLMSLGIIGGLIYLGITTVSIYYSVVLIFHNSKYFFFPLLFLQYFIYSMFSRTLIALPLYWTSIACVFSVYLIDRSRFLNKRPSSPEIADL